MTVYMQVTRDAYELPIAIADSVHELSRIVGTDVRTIRSSISHMKSGRRKHSAYQAIEIGDLEE